MNKSEQQNRAITAVFSTIPAMSDAYEKLLDAIIGHLDEQRTKGERFVVVKQETLMDLKRPLHRKAVLTTSNAAHTKHHSAGKSDECCFFSKQPPHRQAKPSNPASLECQSLPEKAVPIGEKQAEFDRLKLRVAGCKQCPHLFSSRKNIVFGTGNIHAELMFVGEAPGADEDRQGEPFVGPAGQLLTKIIHAMGFTRETVYIGNILKCRPDTPGQRYGNRKPTLEEMAVCLPFLVEQIRIIQPKVIVALGGTAAEGLTGDKVSIMAVRGQWRTFQGIPVMLTNHPSFLLRREKEGGGGFVDKRKVWEDMLQVLEKLGRPITEQQRNYFLSRLSSS